MRENQRMSTTLELTQSDQSEGSHLLSTLRDLMSAFTAEQDLHTVLKRMLLAIKDLLKVNILFLELYSDEEQKYFVKIYEGEKNITLDDDLREEVIQKGQSHLINDLSSFPKYKKLSEAGYFSILVVPLKRRERSFGMVGVLTKESRDFLSQELELLVSIASQASLLVENAQLFEKTKFLSITDGLTNIYNHRHFQEKLEEFTEMGIKGEQSISLIMADVDYFKHYNDTNGHVAGDKVLWKVADIFKKNTKGRDVVARYGGEEFVIILPHTEKKDAVVVARKLKEEIENTHFHNEEKQPNGKLTVSFGVSSLPADSKTRGELIKNADERLYKAKTGGRNQVVSE